MDLTLPPLSNLAVTIIGVALLWWRMRVAEHEIRKLRDDRHGMNAAVARTEAKVDLLAALAGDMLKTLITEKRT